MPRLERMMGLRGPRFYRDGDSQTVQFVNHYDTSTRDGPRPATEADQEAHPKAWADFTTGGDQEGAFKPFVVFKDPPDGRPQREGPRARGSVAPTPAGAAE